MSSSPLSSIAPRTGNGSIARHAGSDAIILASSVPPRNLQRTPSSYSLIRAQVKHAFSAKRRFNPKAQEGSQTDGYPAALSVLIFIPAIHQQRLYPASVIRIPAAVSVKLMSHAQWYILQLQATSSPASDSPLERLCKTHSCSPPWWDRSQSHSVFSE